MGGSSSDEHITDTRIKMMEEKSKNREEWKHLLKETRVQKGLKSHRWMDGIFQEGVKATGAYG
jgi:hypothetical protein